ncbi:MAG TPA: hypothetical protein VGB85_19060 [Nannocystis sp.]|jgi:uncharacterized protein YneR
MYRIPEIVTAGSVLLLQAACPPQIADTTDTTTDPGSTTSAATTTTDGLTSTTAPTTSASTGSTTTDITATTTGDTTTTGEDTSEGPSDPGCTFPGSTSGGAASPEVDETCACVSEASVICGDKLCPTVMGTCDRIDFDEVCDGTWKFADDALTCAIMAAAAGTEGTIEWYFTANGGFGSHSGFLHIVSDRRAIRQDVEVDDLTTAVSDTELWNLDDAAWFEDCLDLETFCERMDCFFAGTAGPALSLCQEGYSYYYYG